jgi:hypothetical protein
VAEAETFLHEELKNGPRAEREMIELARQLGIHPKTLERAREKRGIVTSKAGKDAGWIWHYPNSHCRNDMPFRASERLVLE